METLRLGPSLHLGTTEITPVEQWQTGARHQRHGFYLYGGKQPKWVIVRSETGVHIFSMEGREVPAEELRRAGVDAGL